MYCCWNHAELDSGGPVAYPPLVYAAWKLDGLCGYVCDVTALGRRGMVAVTCDTTGGARLVGVGMPKCDGSSFFCLGITNLGSAPRFSCADGGLEDFFGDLLLEAELFRRSNFPSLSVTISTLFVPGEMASTYLATAPPSLCDFLSFPDLLSRCETFGVSLSFRALCFDPCTRLPASSTS